MSRQVKKVKHFKRGHTRTFLLFLIISLVGVPLIVQAGFLTFFTNFFTSLSLSSSIQYSETVLNSQNVSLLQAALNYDPNPSKGGGGITIVGGSALLPDAGPSGTLANIEDRPPSSDQISIYVVREGDSISQIAEMFNVSAGTVIWANDIKRGSLISPGQTLVILPISGVQHIVKKGDTIAGIAKKYKGDVEEIMQYNNLADDVVLAIGDVVTIPEGEIPTPVYSSASRIVRGSGGPTYSGYYLKPVLSARRTQGLHGYNGVDLGVSFGTPILAAASGSVIISRGAGWNGGYGKYIVIKHANGTQTLYAHNSRNIVYQGEYIIQGQVIGYVGSSGRSTGPHLHFEIRGARNPF